MSEKKLRKWWSILWVIIIGIDVAMVFYQDKDLAGWTAVCKCLVGFFVFYRVIALKKWAILWYPIISLPFMTLIGVLQEIALEPHAFQDWVVLNSPIFTLYGVFIYISWELMVCNRLIYNNPNAIFKD